MTSKLPNNQGYHKSNHSTLRPKINDSFYKVSTFVNLLPPDKHLCVFSVWGSEWRTLCQAQSAVSVSWVTPPSLTSRWPSPGRLRRMRPASAPSVSPSPQTQMVTPRRGKLSGNIPNIFRNPPEYSTEFQEWLRQKYLPKCHILKYRKVKHKSWKMSHHSLKYSTMTWQALGF